MRSAIPEALYPHSSANSRISACANVCSSTYRTPGHSPGGSRRSARHLSCPAARARPRLKISAWFSQAASRSSLNRRKIPSPRVCAQGTQEGASRAIGTMRSRSVDRMSHSGESIRVNP